MIGAGDITVKTKQNKVVALIEFIFLQVKLSKALWHCKKKPRSAYRRGDIL